MLDWIVDNFSTIIIAVVTFTAIGGIIRRMFKNKKDGKNSCGCNCKNCSSQNGCH